MRIVIPDRISMYGHPQVSETMIQEIIAGDPTILGLGDLALRDFERQQPRAGRLDILMQDTNTDRRYEIELQLGKTDESHIIRCIEYWDIERKRYPQYDHCAVLIAEEITSRFYNVISLFNGHIPLIAIQMSAVKLGEDIGVIFTKILDEMPLGMVDGDEGERETTDRAYWINKGSERTVAVVDRLVPIINQIAPGYELKYNKFYIGLAKNGQPNNFVEFRPAKKHVRIDIKHDRNDVIQEILNDQEFDDMGYTPRNSSYRFRLTVDDVDVKMESLKSLFEMSYNYFC
jgi:hypothetical protein